MCDQVNKFKLYQLNETPNKQKKDDENWLACVQCVCVHCTYTTAYDCMHVRCLRRLKTLSSYHTKVLLNKQRAVEFPHCCAQNSKASSPYEIFTNFSNR